MESKPRDKGCINDKVKRKYNLSSSSKPWDFAEVFLPFKENKKDDEHFSFQLMTRWTNMKAVQSSAGSMTYKDWKPFTERELRQHFGLYVLNGISPTPRVENKFQSQRHDPVGGNDFVFNSFGPGAQRQHKHFSDTSAESKQVSELEDQSLVKMDEQDQSRDLVLWLYDCC